MFAFVSPSIHSPYGLAISISQPKRMIVLVVHYLLDLCLVEGSIILVIEVRQAQGMAKLVNGNGLYIIICSIVIAIRIPVVVRIVVNI
jgi:hypothetical protein